MAAPRNTTGYASESAEVQKQRTSRIGEEHGALFRELEEVEEEVASLFGRLNDVLAPSSGSGETNGQPDVQDSPMAEAFKAHRRQAQRIRANLAELKARLQL